MNEVARTVGTFGYKDLSDAISYADEPWNPSIQKEGKAFRQWRSAVLGFIKDYLADLNSGKVKFVSNADIIKRIPALELPVSNSKLTP